MPDGEGGRLCCGFGERLKPWPDPEGEGSGAEALPLSHLPWARGPLGGQRPSAGTAPAAAGHAAPAGKGLYSTRRRRTG